MSPRKSEHFDLQLWVSAFAFALFLSVQSACAESSVASDADQSDHRQLILDWRKQREEGLKSEHGWLSLVGFEWLKAGPNRIGHGLENDIRLPGGPAYWGTIDVEGKSLRFTRAEDSSVTVDGKTPEVFQLVADNDGEPTVVQSGSMAFRVIFRESYALRVSDSQAPARTNFRGLDYFDVREDWIVEGRLDPAEPGETIDIANVLGQVSPTPVYGTFEFVRGNATHRLVALGDESSESLWFIFADRTNGKSTYGAGRFLYSEGLPDGGLLVVDFNKAYNPPCAFNEYSTCPLPPPQNRLDLAVTAGEKQFHALPDKR